MQAAEGELSLFDLANSYNPKKVIKKAPIISDLLYRYQIIIYIFAFTAFCFENSKLFSFWNFLKPYVPRNLHTLNSQALNF